MSASCHLHSPEGAPALNRTAGCVLRQRHLTVWRHTHEATQVTQPAASHRISSAERCPRAGDARRAPSPWARSGHREPFSGNSAAQLFKYADNTSRRRGGDRRPRRSTAWGIARTGVAHGLDASGSVVAIAHPRRRVQTERIYTGKRPTQLTIQRATGGSGHPKGAGSVSRPRRDRVRHELDSRQACSPPPSASPGKLAEVFRHAIYAPHNSRLECHSIRVPQRSAFPKVDRGGRCSPWGRLQARSK